MSAPRVLVCEDEAVIAMLLELVLQQAGMPVCGVVGNEQAALEVAAQTRPTHAVLDVQLSPGNGCEVARQLRKLYGTAIVFVTAYGEQVRCDPELPGAVLVEKPADPGVIVAALYAAREIADGHQARPPPRAQLVGRSASS